LALEFVWSVRACGFATRGRPCPFLTYKPLLHAISEDDVEAQEREREEQEPEREGEGEVGAEERARQREQVQEKEDGEEEEEEEEEAEVTYVGGALRELLLVRFLGSRATARMLACFQESASFREWRGGSIMCSALLAYAGVC
jgi:hypothetical protein